VFNRPAYPSSTAAPRQYGVSTQSTIASYGYSFKTTSAPAEADASSPEDLSGLSSIQDQVYQVEEEKASEPESDVFYIYYENENQENPTVKDTRGITIEEDESKKYSGEIFENNNVPVFSLVQEEKAPLFYDIPIKVEESGEGFTPPSIQDIRTIYVPLENAINVPDSFSTFDISVGTSFGYKGKKNQKKKTFPNFPSGLSSSSAEEVEETKPVKKVNKDVVDIYETSEGVSIRRPVRRPSKAVRLPSAADSSEESDLKSDTPYGTRLGPREHYNPLGL